MIAALLTTSAAQAVSITNRDDGQIKITIIEGDARQDQVIQPGKVIEGVCQKGCIIRLNDSDNDEYELEGSEAVSVEEGFLYYDSPLEDGAPQGGSTEPADKPKSE
ncbi:MAG TPA: hypothetical protein PKD49_02205 [Hyphomicrobium sp.]|nr:hypothetical protein [Hyphomicrobium sp.]